jgi:HAMP domain-containing protein
MRAPSEKRDEGERGPLNSGGGPSAAGASIVRSRLFIKYVILFVAVVSLALIANGAFDVYFSYQEQKASLVRVQREQAEAAAGKIGQFISEIESQVGWTTQLPWSTGVSIAQVNLKLIWDVLSKIKFAGHGRAYVVDAAGRLIAHPDISLVLRNTDMSQLPQVKSARAAVAGSAGEQVQEAVDIEGQKVLTASAPVAPLGWHVFVETPIEEAYAPLYAALKRTALVLLGALALAFAAGLFLARRMVVPIQALRAGAARLGSGDLGQRIAIKSGDEVESLANQFNDMAGRLQESYANLEQSRCARRS